MYKCKWLFEVLSTRLKVEKYRLLENLLPRISTMVTHQEVLDPCYRYFAITEVKYINA